MSKSKVKSSKNNSNDKETNQSIAKLNKELYMEKKRPKTTKTADESQFLESVPKTFVLRSKSGLGSTKLQQLVIECRTIFEPNTATKLKEQKKNSLRDYLDVANFMNVTHFWMFSTSFDSYNLRMAKVPSGPTLHFKINSYVYISSINDMLKQSLSASQKELFLNVPLLILNDFDKTRKEVKLVADFLLNSFQNIHSLKSEENEEDGVEVFLTKKDKTKSRPRRVVMFNYNNEKDLIELRQYLINYEDSKKENDSGINKIIKSNKELPNLEEYNDVGEYFIKQSLSLEGKPPITSDTFEKQIKKDLQNLENENKAPTRIKLKEIGPRLDLELYKIETGFSKGEVLYHKYVQKSKNEIQTKKTEIKTKNKLKEELKKKQEENLLKKQKKANNTKKAKVEAEDNDDIVTDGVDSSADGSYVADSDGTCHFIVEYSE